jgi:DNA-binding transcriptional LysR family regulator
MLDVPKLATLRAVVRHGSFSAAGQALGLTQPAVSRQIALLERQAGTPLLRRTPGGVVATEAGRLLVGHADAVLGRLALAEEELAALAGLRRGQVRLGSFFTALVYLSAEVTAVMEEQHPALFRNQGQVIVDQLVDRSAAMSGLVAGDLDIAIVFELAHERVTAPDDVEIVPLFTDPPRVLVPATHPLARAAEIPASALAGDTWIRAHDGSAARTVDQVLARADITPRILAAGHGDEPVEAQAFVAAGRGVTVAHRLNVILNPDQVASVPLAGGQPARHIQAAIMRDQRAPAPRAVLAALREIGRRVARRPSR